MAKIHTGTMPLGEKKTHSLGDLLSLDARPNLLDRSDYEPIKVCHLLFPTKWQR
jgi:hypothetical protein